MVKRPSKTRSSEPLVGDEIRFEGRVWRIARLNRVPGGEFLAQLSDLSGTETRNITLKRTAA
mgnify:FL=1